jgi:hypothetical protein
MADRWEWANEGVVSEDGHLLWYEKEGSARFASGGPARKSSRPS